MIKKSNKMVLILIFCAFVCEYGYPQHADLSQLESVQISSPKPVISVGEALVVKLVYRFKKSQCAAHSGKVLDTIYPVTQVLVELNEGAEDWVVEHIRADAIFCKEGIEYYPLPLACLSPPSALRLTVQDVEGLEYACYFLVAYNDVSGQLVFRHPGCYKLTGITGKDSQFANIIDVEVNVPSPDQFIELEPRCIDFLMGQNYCGPDRVACEEILADLEQMIEAYPQSLISHWAAAKIGIHIYKRDNGGLVEARSTNTVPAEDRYADARRYLAQGLKLPSDFAIRQEVLYRLGEIEFKARNYDRALILFEELSNKYPHSKYRERSLEAMDCARLQKSKDEM